jgi:hypothetical protein
VRRLFVASVVTSLCFVVRAALLPLITQYGVSHWALLLTYFAIGEVVPALAMIRAFTTAVARPQSAPKQRAARTHAGAALEQQQSPQQAESAWPAAWPAAAPAAALRAAAEPEPLPYAPPLLPAASAGASAPPSSAFGAFGSAPGVPASLEPSRFALGSYAAGAFATTPAASPAADMPHPTAAAAAAAATGLSGLSRLGGGAGASAGVAPSSGAFGFGLSLGLGLGSAQYQYQYGLFDAEDSDGAAGVGAVTFAPFGGGLARAATPRASVAAPLAAAGPAGTGTAVAAGTGLFTPPTPSRLRTQQAPAAGAGVAPSVQGAVAAAGADAAVPSLSAPHVTPEAPPASVPTLAPTRVETLTQTPATRRSAGAPALGLGLGQRQGAAARRAQQGTLRGGQELRDLGVEAAFQEQLSLRNTELDDAVERHGM